MGSLMGGLLAEPLVDLKPYDCQRVKLGELN